MNRDIWVEIAKLEAESTYCDVRYGPDDHTVEDGVRKHIYTKKMADIIDLIYDGKGLESAKFKPTADDRKFFEMQKKVYELKKKANDGKPPKQYVDFFNETPM